MSNATTPSIPSGMVEVTQDAFFAALKADSRDIMPHQEHRTFTTWESVNRETWGWSAPGWANPGAHKAMYAIREARKND